MSEKPLKAIAEITVTEFNLIQIINFYYFDPDNIYQRIAKNLLSKNYDEEFYLIIDNMQSYLDEDSVFLNKKKLTLDIIDAHINFPETERLNYPLLTFEIKSSPLVIVNGKNVIELYGREQFSPYPISVDWNFPGKVLNVLSSTDHVIAGNSVHFKTEKNGKISGSEKIEFFSSL